MVAVIFSQGSVTSVISLDKLRQPDFNYSLLSIY